MSLALLATEAAEGGAHGVGFPLLPALILVPLVGAVLLAAIPRRESREDIYRQLGLLFSLVAGAISVWVLVEFKLHTPGYQMEASRDWIASLGISWHFGVDGISLFLVVLTGVLFPIAILATRPHHDPKPYYAWLLVLMAASMGAFLAADLLVFFLFFELTLVPMYFLIGMWGYGNRVYAANKFFLYTFLGSALMLVGILALAFLNSANTGGPLTFDIQALATSQDLSTGTGRWIFLAFVVGFAVKVPLFPLHTWLPDAHTEAPTAGSVILAGVMLKLGTYGFIRFGLFLFPEAAHWFAPVMMTLGVVGIIYGAVVATMQSDLKRLVAYSSVAHMGFIVLGTFALNVEGIEGGVLQMVNHGISTGALFLLVGIIYERRHTREIDKLGGLQVSAPVLAGVFTLVMLSSVGLPGLNGFVGEFLTLLGAFRTYRWWAVVAAAGVILASLYLLWAYQRVFHGTPDEDNADTPDLKLTEGLVLAPLVALIVFLGVWPQPVLERIEPTVAALVDHIEEQVDGFDLPPVGTISPSEAGGHGEGTDSGADGSGADGSEADDSGADPEGGHG